MADQFDIERRTNREDRRVSDARIKSFDEILSFLVHEIRNPLAVVKGFAATLEESAAAMDPEAIRNSAAAISRSADNLSSLVDSLADIRSLGQEEMDLHRVDMLISALIEQTVIELDPLTSGRHINVHIEDDVLVRVDRTRIRQVLTNLISNAVKFSPPASPVDITVSRADDTVEICVTDHGPGIPADRLHELFQKFSRLGSTVKGTGVGLYISRGIARAHGGDLRLGDTDPASGCSFILSLPIHTASRPKEQNAEKDHRPR